MNKRPTNKELRSLVEQVEACDDFDCSDRIMNTIKKKQVKMRSRWIVLTEYFGLRTTWVLLVLFVVVIFNLVLFIISRSPQWEFLEFGTEGWKLFVTHFPYGYMALAAFSLMLCCLLMKRFSWSYLLPFKIFSLLFVFFSLIAGAVAFASGVNEKLYQRLVEGPDADDSLLARVYCLTANQPLDAQNAVMGEVMYVDHDSLVLQTPSLEVVTVYMNDHTTWPGQESLQKFDVVKMIGVRKNDTFLAKHIKKEVSQRMPLQRGSDDCADQKEWKHKQMVVEQRRQAVTPPLSPVMGTAQLIRNIY